MNTMLSKITAAPARPWVQPICMRCSGHLEPELCIDLESDSGCCTFWALRCLQCGDILDETILRNRAPASSDASMPTAA
jgi:hypothetical protein